MAAKRKAAAPPALALTLDKASYVKGDKITATYVLTGADPVMAPFSGSTVVDGLTITTAGTTTITHAVGPFSAPIVNGVALTATADPHVWTGTA